MEDIEVNLFFEELAKILEKLVIETIKEYTCSCKDCINRKTCEYAFDFYNTNDDCLLTK